MLVIFYYMYSPLYVSTNNNVVSFFVPHDIPYSVYYSATYSVNIYAHDADGVTTIC